MSEADTSHPIWEHVNGRCIKSQCVYCDVAALRARVQELKSIMAEARLVIERQRAERIELAAEQENAQGFHDHLTEVLVENTNLIKAGDRKMINQHELPLDTRSNEEKQTDAIVTIANELVMIKHLMNDLLYMAKREQENSENHR